MTEEQVEQVEQRIGEILADDDWLPDLILWAIEDAPISVFRALANTKPESGEEAVREFQAALETVARYHAEKEAERY